MSSSEPRITNHAPRKKILVFLEMIKFEHSIFALPFAYLGMILGARGWPGWRSFLLITAAMVLFRTMAMAANRLIDQNVDAANPRTQNRALPAGLLSRDWVWRVAGFTAVMFGWVCWQISPLCLWLSPIPFVLAWIYPFLKRVSWVCHFILGLVLGIAPYGAWIAVGGDGVAVPLGLLLGVLFWVAGFDIIYALLDSDFDRKQGLHSVPVKLGDKNARLMARWLHGLTLVCWGFVGVFAQLSRIYFLGLIVAAVLMMREHFLVANQRDAKSVNEAFFKLNAWISVLIFLSACLGLN